jgi:rhamnosyltransferase
MSNPRVGQSTIAAGVVTYEPDLDLLATNIAAIKSQVDLVYVFDNGSTNSGEMAARIGNAAVVLLGGRNQGIAAALNAIARRAMADGYEWLVTLDQDSVPMPGMVRELADSVDDRIALSTPYVIDRNKLSIEEYRALRLPRVQEYRRAASKGAITSGGLLRLSVLRDIGGFDERFFIDYVDYDLNIRLMKSGYSIVRANRAQLSHQVGDARRTWLRAPRRTLDGKWTLENFYSFGHSPSRCYYKSRNRILYTRKHWRSIGLRNEGIVQIPQQIFLTALFEKERLAKLRAFSAGIRDGISERMRPLDRKFL